MKIEFKNFQGKIDAKSLSKKARLFIVKRESWILVLIALVFIVYCGYLWYKYNHNYQWDEAEKQTYIQNKKTGVDFEKEKFDEVLQDVSDRQSRYEKELEVPTDIFRLN